MLEAESRASGDASREPEDLNAANLEPEYVRRPIDRGLNASRREGEEPDAEHDELCRALDVREDQVTVPVGRSGLSTARVSRGRGWKPSASVGSARGASQLSGGQEGSTG